MPRPHRRRNPWPASKLSDPDLMHDLHTVAKAIKQPITAIIAMGVREHVAALRDGMDASPPTRTPIGFDTISAAPPNTPQSPLESLA